MLFWNAHYCCAPHLQQTLTEARIMTLYAVCAAISHYPRNILTHSRLFRETYSIKWVTIVSCYIANVHTMWRWKRAVEITNVPAHNAVKSITTWFVHHHIRNTRHMFLWIYIALHCWKGNYPNHPNLKEIKSAGMPLRLHCTRSWRAFNRNSSLLNYAAQNE